MDYGLYGTDRAVHHQRKETDMANLYISETHVNRTEKRLCCDPLEPYETFTDQKGRLFLELQRDYGRCIGKQYVDRKDGTTVQTGWVFQKRMRYQDSPETYLHETWITVWSELPTRIPAHWTGGTYAF
jgi:hypothetical protein